MPYFVLNSQQGPAWQESKAMREQALWSEHVAFINEAMYHGRIILGGPLGDGHPHRALLLLNEKSEVAVKAWADTDPWVQSRILRIHTIEPFEILVSDDKLDRLLTELTKPHPPTEFPD